MKGGTEREPYIYPPILPLSPPPPPPPEPLISESLDCCYQSAEPGDGVSGVLSSSQILTYRLRSARAARWMDLCGSTETFRQFVLPCSGKVRFSHLVWHENGFFFFLQFFYSNVSTILWVLSSEMEPAV